jgi:glutathione synthase/RimK-type ligase-like ATP-grasp enzyme
MHKTLIVVDSEELVLDDSYPEVLSFEKYLQDYPKLNEGKTRIINLCDTEHYLSKGYYCSLLAEARQHLVLPSIKVINELRVFNHDESLLLQLKRDLKEVLTQGEWLEETIYFGWTSNAPLQKLGKRLFLEYPAPLLRLRLQRLDGDLSLKIERCAFSNLSISQKSMRWDMAILVNPEEKVPPSNREAIAKFIKAAAKYGIAAETITADQFQTIGQYDALFIRETTAIDHHTYRLANRAEKLGLVVIDDPVSILRCCNKVYLQDAFSYKKVPSLRTQVVIDSSQTSLDLIEKMFDYPMVLKMPEGSFSRGVFKVSSREELKQKLDELFLESALVLVQEYLYTEFDWRVGVLNGRAIYACRYLMARNHWQIYNHQAKRHFSGGFETLPTFEVPKVVLDAAVRAAKSIGKGLYGVDIKEHEKHAYVIEVNDNPNIDHDVEDAFLGDELYMLIMSEFQQRLESRGR